MKREINSKTGKLRNYTDIAKKNIASLTRLQSKIPSYNPVPGRNMLKSQFKEYLEHKDKVKKIVGISNFEMEMKKRKGKNRLEKKIY